MKIEINALQGEIQDKNAKIKGLEERIISSRRSL